MMLTEKKKKLHAQISCSILEKKSSDIFIPRISDFPKLTNFLQHFLDASSNKSCLYFMEKNLNYPNSSFTAYDT